jgi:hypothetical protein
MDKTQADPFDLARATVMLTAYDARWAGDMAQYEVLGVEEEFRAKLVNPETGHASPIWTLGGKLDVRVREVASKRALIVEHKTASGDVGAGSDYVKRLRLDGQISVYYAGAEALGSRVDGCLYDVLVKPSQRPLKATPAESRKYTKDGRLYAAQRAEDETPGQYQARLVEAVASSPNDYLMRTEVVRLEEEMRDAMADVWQLAQQLREAERLGRYPRNPGACVQWGRTCDYFPICVGEASAEDVNLYRKTEALHPELEGDNANGHLLTASRLGCARACQRMHRIRYGEGIRPAVEAETLRFGHLIHAGLEGWWLAKDGARLDAALAAIQPAHQPAAEAAL